jgi:nucleoside 2-deoxyribosyltransferase
MVGEVPHRKHGCMCVSTSSIRQPKGTMMADKAPAQKTCFIVGPIGEALSPVRELADWLLKGVIKPVLEAEEFSYVVKRADHDTDPGSITSAVISDLVDADLVIADLTGFNPNAFYELGIRHALRKPAIHITAEVVKLPFDNADQRTIFVNIANYESVQDAKARLRSAVQAVNRDGYQVSNPVIQAAAVTALKESGDPKDQIIAGLEERLSRLEQDRASLKDMLPISDREIALKRGRGATNFLTVSSHDNQSIASLLARSDNDNTTRLKLLALLSPEQRAQVESSNFLNNDTIRNLITGWKHGPDDGTSNNKV